MEQFDALDVIARTRGKIEMDETPTGGMLFPLWGWLTAIFYLAEFILWQVFRQEWCMWLWVGIPVVGIPLMVRLLRKDRERTHRRTHGSRLVLDYWIFAACAFCIGGFIFGFCDIYEMVENPLICLLIGIGAFITGETARFRPMIIGGLAGASVGICSFLLQGEIWYWQMAAIVLVAFLSLIVPGHMFGKRAGDGV